MKKVNKVFTDLHERLLTVSAEGQLHDNPENVHIFRVNYKRLRAFVRWLNRGKHSKKQLHVPAELKNIYRYLGKLRDWQLLRSRLSEKLGVLQLLPLIETVDEYTSVQQKLVDEIPVRKIVLSSEKYFGTHTTELPDLVSVELFLDSKWVTLYTISKMNPFIDDHAHSFRKNLKDIYYVIETAQSMKIPLFANGYYPGNKKEEFLSLMKELGQYNDLCISINHLSSIAWRDPVTINILLDEWMHKKQSWFSDLHTKVVHLEMVLLPEESHKDPRQV
jgi:CHAD domain-containing protein